MTAPVTKYYFGTIGGVIELNIKLRSPGKHL